jgi:hypothetical protein
MGDEHPYGTTLLSRDNKANRELFPKQTEFGHIPIAPTICTEDGQCPHYSHKEDKEDQDQESSSTHHDTPIHILVAAFRDRLCGRTIHNAFTRAAHPKRVFLRIIDQTQADSELLDDAGCWETYCHDYNENCDEYKSQVQTVAIDATLSKGPTFARSKLSAMIYWDHVHKDDEDPTALDFRPVDKQDFCMQIDSHMDFSDGYDEGLVAMFHRTENDYAVLSTYVADIEQNNKDPKMVPNLCMVKFTSSIRNWGTKECQKLTRPKLTNAMWGAGLSFHRCHAELSVPVDPYLDNVFDGEEGSRGIRFFTHGYDVYTPDKVLVTHDYHTHQGNPVVHTWGRGNKLDGDGHDNGNDSLSWKWNEEIEALRDSWHTFGTKRVNMLLGIGSTFQSTEKEREEVERIRASRFGLGDKRTLEQAVEFTGINLLEERMEENKCGNLIWVPYDETADFGVVEEVLARGYDGGGAVAEKAKPKAKPAARAKINNATPQQLRALAPKATATDEDTTDIRTVVLLIVLLLAIIKVVSIGWKRKDEKHKE